MKKTALYKAFSAILAAAIIFTGVLSLEAHAAKKAISISKENGETVEQVILDYIDQNKDTTAAISVTVFDDSGDICSVVYGESNMTDHINADENTVYEWGSITKMLVWTSAMQLYEQGKLDLNEDIRTYLQDGFLKNLSFDRSVTMLDLMNHTAGFQENLWETEVTEINRIKPLDKALADIAPAQTYAPGETVSYSNWGAALAGYVVECISGMDFADYVRENIFIPLGMEHTSIRPDASDNEWVSEQRKKTHCYSTWEDDFEDLGECRSYIHIYPAGSACGTISDLAIFAKAFLCKSEDCPLFEKKDTLLEMVSASVCFADGTTPRICHGLICNDYGSLLVGHGGNTTGFSSNLQLDMGHKNGIVIMTNKQGDRTYKEGLVELLYGDYEMQRNIGGSFEKADIAGYYKVGRSCLEEGVLSLTGFLSDRLILREQDGHIVHKDGIATLTQVSDTAAVMELISGTKLHLIIRKDNKGNVTGLENFHALDYLKISALEYYTDLVMLILLAASTGIMSILFMVHVLRLKKYKGQAVCKFKRMEMLSALTAVVMLIDGAVIYVLGLGISGMAKNYFVLPCIVMAVLALFEAIFIIAGWRLKDKPKRKILFILETIFGTIIVAGILYWKLYQFWGF